MSTETWRIWMHPLYPNIADARWYPPHVPTPDEGTQEWAEQHAKKLNDADPWPAWRYEARRP